LPAAKSIYPPSAESRSYSAIHGAALRAQSGIHAVFRFQVFASQKPGKPIRTGIHAGHPWRIKTLDFACGKIHLSTCGGEPFYSAIHAAALRAQSGIPAVFRHQVFASQKSMKSLQPASMPAFTLRVWGKAPNSENQNAARFCSHSGAFPAESATVYCLFVMINC
jgi:hypothetical protein